MTVDQPAEACEHSALLAHLRRALAGPLAWYADALDLERCEQVDESYIYDGAIEQFDQMSRGEAEMLLRIVYEATQ